MTGPFRPWIPRALAEMVVLGDGEHMLVHLRHECEGHSCSVHDPSPHPLASRPLIWRPWLWRMDRICPHDLPHPDPDGLAADTRLGRDTSTDHDCDGCCRPAGTPQ